jgi:hypothetical protein
MTALDVECSICHAVPGKACTAPTDTAVRVIRKSPHFSRHVLAEWGEE